MMMAYARYTHSPPVGRFLKTWRMMMTLMMSRLASVRELGGSTGNFRGDSSVHAGPYVIYQLGEASSTAETDPGR